MAYLVSFLAALQTGFSPFLESHPLVPYWKPPDVPGLSARENVPRRRALFTCSSERSLRMLSVCWNVEHNFPMGAHHNDHAAFDGFLVVDSWPFAVFFLADNMTGILWSRGILKKKKAKKGYKQRGPITADPIDIVPQYLREPESLVRIEDSCS